MLVLTKLIGVAARAVGLVGGTSPGNHFVVCRVAGVTCPEAVRLVANTDVAVSVSR